MKKTINKAVIAFSTFTYFLYNMTFANAELDETGLLNWINGYLRPLRNILLIAGPVVAVIYLGVELVKYFSEQNENNNVKPFWATAKKAIIALVIFEGIVVILGFFGISSN